MEIIGLQQRILYGYAGRAFVGWNIPVHKETSLKFARRFFAGCGNFTIYDAVVLSAADCRSIDGCNGFSEKGNSLDCNPAFYGDSNYWGWAW